MLGLWSHAMVGLVYVAGRQLRADVCIPGDVVHEKITLKPLTSEYKEDTFDCTFGTVGVRMMHRDIPIFTTSWFTAWFSNEVVVFPHSEEDGEDDNRVSAQQVASSIRPLQKGTVPTHGFIVHRTGTGLSAGLTHALSLLDRLAHSGRLSRGKKMVATGGVEPDGKVTQVGGIRLKVISCIREKTEALLLPESNLDEAKPVAAGKIALIPVRSVQHAIEQLGRFHDNPSAFTVSHLCSCGHDDK